MIKVLNTDHLLVYQEVLNLHYSYRLKKLQKELLHSKKVKGMMLILLEQTMFGCMIRTSSPSIKLKFTTNSMTDLCQGNSMGLHITTLEKLPSKMAESNL